LSLELSHELEPSILRRRLPFDSTSRHRPTFTRSLSCAGAQQRPSFLRQITIRIHDDYTSTPLLIL
jgi:hypothetical protein